MLKYISSLLAIFIAAIFIFLSYISNKIEKNIVSQLNRLEIQGYISNIDLEYKKGLFNSSYSLDFKSKYDTIENTFSLNGKIQTVALHDMNLVLAKSNSNINISNRINGQLNSFKSYSSDLVMKISIDAFEIKNLQSFSIKADEIYIDLKIDVLSEIFNTSDISLISINTNTFALKRDGKLRFETKIKDLFLNQEIIKGDNGHISNLNIIIDSFNAFNNDDSLDFIKLDELVINNSLLKDFKDKKINQNIGFIVDKITFGDNKPGAANLYANIEVGGENSYEEISKIFNINILKDVHKIISFSDEKLENEIRKLFEIFMKSDCKFDIETDMDFLDGFNHKSSISSSFDEKLINTSAKIYLKTQPSLLDLINTLTYGLFVRLFLDPNNVDNPKLPVDWSKYLEFKDGMYILNLSK